MQPRVAHFSADFLPYSQTFVYEELIHHQRYQMEAFAHTLKFPERFPFELVHYLRPTKDVWSGLAFLRYMLTGHSSLFDERFQTHPFDLVHAQFGPTGAYAMRYAQNFQLPLIVSFGGYDVPLLQTRKRFRPQYWLYWLHSKKLIRRIDRFLPVSQDLADKLLQLGAPPDRVQVFHRGVRVPETIAKKGTGQNPDHLRIVMVGRFVEKKGFEFGIRGFAQALKNGLKGELRIAGSGKLRARYDKIIAELGIGERVCFLGSVPHERVEREMEEADVVLIPSVVASDGDTEGIPNVLKEAMARGTVAVGSIHGGIPDIIEHERTGFLVKEKDVDGIAQTLGTAAAHPERRQQIGEAGWEKMKRELDIRVRAEILERHYDEVIEEFRSRVAKP
jgi:colanic acid/amylovoran biosynthesis glycosyltransferase